jgi:hypothetical protein
MALSHERSICLPCRRSWVRIPSAASRNACKSRGVSSSPAGLCVCPASQELAKRVATSRTAPFRRCLFAGDSSRLIALAFCQDAEGHGFESPRHRRRTVRPRAGTPAFVEKGHSGPALLLFVRSERRRRLRVDASFHRPAMLSGRSQSARLAQACEGGVSISASLARRIGRSTDHYERSRKCESWS